MVTWFKGRSIQSIRRMQVIIWLRNANGKAAAKVSTKIHANVLLQVFILLLRCFRKGSQGDAGCFLSRFTGVYLVFEVFQTKVAHFCFCIVRKKILLLTWSGTALGTLLAYSLLFNLLRN